MLNIAMHVTLSVGIRAALSDGDLETADKWIQEMGMDLSRFGLGYRNWYYIFITRAALLRGNINEAVAHRPEMMRLSIATGATLGWMEGLLISAEVFDREGKATEARAELDQALEIARATGSPYFEFMARLTEAQLCYGSGEKSQALTALTRAMSLGKAGGYINSFVWQPKVMAKLCAKALEAGIEVEYVQSLIRKRKLVPEEAPVEIERWPWAIKIYTLGRFEVFKDDQPLQFKGKVQRKPLALLKAIIALGGLGVREEQLIDELWPDAEGDAARFALTSAVHRLRRLLGYDGAIVRRENELSLDNRYCWVDVWAVERLVGRAEKSREEGDVNWSETIRLTNKAAELYKGSFLSGETQMPASIFEARIRRRLLRQLVHVAQHAEEAGRWQQAIDYYETAMAVDPCAEDVCRSLMSAYHHLGRPGDVLASYKHCRAALADRLGTEPSAATESLLKRLQTHTFLAQPRM